MTTSKKETAPNNGGGRYHMWNEPPSQRAKAPMVIDGWQATAQPVMTKKRTKPRSRPDRWPTAGLRAFEGRVWIANRGPSLDMPAESAVFSRFGDRRASQAAFAYPAFLLAVSDAENVKRRLDRAGLYHDHERYLCHTRPTST